MSALLWLGLVAGAGVFWFSRRRGRELDALDGGGPELIPVLERLAREWETRERAIRRLESHGAAAAPALIALLREVPAARYAAESLGRLGDTRALEPLAAVLKHGLPEDYGAARGAAAQALLELGEAGAGALAGAMWGASSDALRAGAEALVRCVDARAAGAARGLMTHPDAGLRRAALRLLVSALEEGAAPDVLRAARDQDGTVREEAFRELGERPRSSGSEEALKEGLLDGDPSARRAAAAALLKWKVRLSGGSRARALVAAGTPEQVSALEAEHARVLVDGLFHEDHAIQTAALARLKSLLTAAPADVPRDALIAVDQLPREAGGRALETVFNGPCDETGHLDYVPVKLDLFPLRQLALQELQKRKKARRDGENG